MATAIGDNFGYKPTAPQYVAKAMDMANTSGPFRNMAGASIAYGLTNGAAFADAISLEPLAIRIIRPTEEGDDLVAKREAFVRPRVIREFLTRYDAAPLPKDNIAQHVLEDLGVPKERTADVLNLILDGAGALGLIHDSNGRAQVDLRGTPVPTESEGALEPLEMRPEEVPVEAKVRIPLPTPKPTVTPAPTPTPTTTAVPPSDKRLKRVYISHGKNRALVEPIKKLLSFGELEPVVSVEIQTVSQGVPDKVMEDMRSAGGAVIHVDEEKQVDPSTLAERKFVNENVLIEVGAAMALYGKRFILVVKEGVKLPSNLQGLLEVRYSGDTPDANAAIKLMEAINDMKKRPLPL